MKTFRRLIPVLLAVFLLLAGCAGSGSSDIRQAISSELGLLKKLDSETVAGYLSGAGLLSDVLPEESKSSSEIQDAFSLFYHNFDYKILSVDIDKEKHTALASVRVTTLDAKSLARDYASSLLRAGIFKAASQENSSETLTAAERYHLLYDLLSDNQYDSLQNTAEISLVRDNDQWEIKRTEELEEVLTGGLGNYLSDADILTPSETLDIYLNSLKEMTSEEMQNYLGIDHIVESTESDKQQIAEALVDQVKQHYDYKITDTSWESAKAVVTAEITTFDGDSILNAYQEDMDQYLSSPDAVIDGAEKRTSIAREKLLAYISDNTRTATNEAVFELENDGSAWRLISPGEDLGNALFGSISGT